MIEAGSERRISPKTYLIAILLRVFLKLIGATYRVQFNEGEALFRKISRGGEPVIFCAWHNRLVYTALLLEKDFVSKGRPFTQLVSQSKDGDISYALMKMFGVDVVCGSSNRGAMGGLLKKYRHMKKNNSSTIIYSDGSQGPLYIAKAGAIFLSQKTGFPLYPISYTADRCWRIKSWDRLIIPKPFSRIKVCLDEEMSIPRVLSREEIESHRLLLQNRLNRMRQAG